MKIFSHYTIGFLAISSILLTSCDNSSYNSDTITRAAKITDRPIIGGAVYCDESENASTDQAGNFTCPDNTQVVRVRGGVNKQTNNDSDEGSMFIGELAAPNNIQYLTPLSTIAVELSSNEDAFIAELFDQVTKDLASTLNIPIIDFMPPPSHSLKLIQLGAQIHQIISSFSTNIDDYKIVTHAFAKVIKENIKMQVKTDIIENVSITLQALNTELMINHPMLALDDITLEKISEITKTFNLEIANAPEMTDIMIAMSAQNEKYDSALTISKDTAPMTFFDHNNNELTSYSLSDFEDDTQVDGHYSALINNQYARINFDAAAFGINKTLNDIKVSVGLLISSTDEGDSRMLSVTTSDGMISMIQDDPNSLDIKLTKGAKFHAQSVSKQGTISSAVFTSNKSEVFSSHNGGIGIQFSDLEAELIKHGYDNLSQHRGNYEITLVINGLKVNTLQNDQVQKAQIYNITSNGKTVMGVGFKGYVSVN